MHKLMVYSDRQKSYNYTNYDNVGNNYQSSIFWEIFNWLLLQIYIDVEYMDTFFLKKYKIKNFLLQFVDKPT